MVRENDAFKKRTEDLSGSHTHTHLWNLFQWLMPSECGPLQPDGSARLQYWLFFLLFGIHFIWNIKKSWKRKDVSYHFCAPASTYTLLCLLVMKCDHLPEETYVCSAVSSCDSLMFHGNGFLNNTMNQSEFLQATSSITNSERTVPDVRIPKQMFFNIRAKNICVKQTREMRDASCWESNDRQQSSEAVSPAVLLHYHKDNLENTQGTSQSNTNLTGPPSCLGLLSANSRMYATLCF